MRIQREHIEVPIRPHADLCYADLTDNLAAKENDYAHHTTFTGYKYKFPDGRVVFISAAEKKDVFGSDPNFKGVNTHAFRLSFESKCIADKHKVIHLTDSAVYVMLKLLVKIWNERVATGEGDFFL